jgi:1,2-diacylglycerol 3-beta-glucosyltransferase
MNLSILGLLLLMAYSLVLFANSRRRRPALLRAPEDLLYVVMVPCLNEELVIRASLDRLLALPYRDVAVLVIDDGSEDATAEIVAEYDPNRVWLLRRRLPDARRGKGAALNAAYRHLLESGLLEGRRDEHVIVCVLDADGRLAVNALSEVGPYFSDPRTGAVQIGVRMYNASERLLARLQDLEFVTFTEVFQRGRMRIGSVGLGGNGQFARLSALRSLGDEPWTDCLTEDLDLGLRLLVGGWTNQFCPTTAVHQQAVTSLRRLIRQRARWFQGHMQCWRRIPAVLRSDLPARATGDLVYHLSSPLLVLLMTGPLMAFLVVVGASLASPTTTIAVVTGGRLETFALWYVLAFGLVPAYAFAYWLKDPGTGFLRALVLAHMYTIYAYLWFPAGWIAAARMVRGRRGWAKTTRTPDPVVAAPGTSF